MQDAAPVKFVNLADLVITNVYQIYCGQTDNNYVNEFRNYMFRYKLCYNCMLVCTAALKF